MTFAEFMQNVPIIFMLAGGVALVYFTGCTYFSLDFRFPA